MFPTKAAHARPPQRPRRRTRPTRIYDIHPRPHPTSSTQRVQTTPSPRGLVWTTPVSDLEGQTISQFIAQLSFEQSQRSPVSAPPTYAEAISRQVNKSIDWKYFENTCFSLINSGTINSGVINCIPTELI
jgi:hypothetical protein